MKTFANLLEDCDQTGVAELRGVLRHLLGQGNADIKFVEEAPLQKTNCQVFRLAFDIEGQCRYVVVKRHKPSIAQRNEAVMQRWLPAVGMGGNAPRLLAAATERSGKCVWHVYEDLGPWALDHDVNPDRVQAAIELIAKLHTSFVGHALLAEARLEGGDLGFSFFSASVRDAVRCLAALHSPAVEISAERAALRDRLLEWLEALLNQQSWRAKLLADCGGPETLLHGDLWTCNTFVRREAGSLRALLIDWDHAAVGPVSYDLSTFLLRFRAPERRGVLKLYSEAISKSELHLPQTGDLNLLFETAELARLSNSIIWPAIALIREPKGWGWERLADVEQWLEQLQPVLPSDESVCAPELARSEAPLNSEACRVDTEVHCSRS